jgi:hypothetical protein
MTIQMPLLWACMWERDNNNGMVADLMVCYGAYTLMIWLSDFLTSALALFNIIVEIFVTYQRISLISRHAINKREKPPWVVCSCVLFFSLAVYSPALFMKEVDNLETRNETTGVVRKDYFSKKTVFGKTSAALLIEETLTLVRISLVTCVLTIVNIVASAKFTAFYKQKSALRLRGNFNFVVYYKPI